MDECQNVRWAQFFIFGKLLFDKNCGEGACLSLQVWIELELERFDLTFSNEDK